MAPTAWTFLRTVVAYSYNFLLVIHRHYDEVLFATQAFKLSTYSPHPREFD